METIIAWVELLTIIIVVSFIIAGIKTHSENKANEAVRKHREEQKKRIGCTIEQDNFER